MFFCSLHGATCKDEGVVMHMRWGKGFSVQVQDPVMELVVTRRYEAALLVVKGMACS